MAQASGSGPGHARPRGRPRNAETDRRILSAVLGLLRRGGPSAVTVEAVAESSGIAKTTIYRRYADRQEVLRAALVDAIGEPGRPPDAEPREKIRWAVDQTWRQMSDVLGPGGLAAIVSDTDRRFTDLCRSILVPYADVLVALIRADVASGQLRGDLDADAAVSMIVGAYLGELVRRGTVEAGFADRCTHLLWIAMTAGPG